MRGDIYAKIRLGINKAVFSVIRREHLFMILMGGMVGTAVGFGTIGFRSMIEGVTRLGWGILSGLRDQEVLVMAMAAPLWGKILIPTAGGLIVGIIIWFVTRDSKGHGVSEVIEAVTLKGGRMSGRMVLADAFASSLCIGSGGSVGVHGPIVLIGSGMGSGIGSLARMTGDRLRTLVACGAAGGIAATFNAPMAGALFSLEIILSEFAVIQFIPIIVSSVIATAISRHYVGNFPAFVAPPYDMLHHSELFLYLILGILAGFVAYAFMRLLYDAGDFFERLNLPPYLKPAIGGAIVGCVGLFFPQIFSIGYETVMHVLSGEIAWTVLLWLLAAKIFATSITLGSGGSGGIFAPTLFLGAVLGGAFGQLSNALLPATTASSGAYALVGMGAFFSGTARAPITAMLIIFEMTANYRIILPLMFACTISLVISALLSRESIYTLKLARKGVNIYEGRDLNILRRLKVSQVMSHEIESVSLSTPLSELVTLMMSSARSYFFVLGEDRRVHGHISLETLRPLLKDYENARGVVIASDLMEQGDITVSSNDSLDMVMQLLGKYGLDEIPVADKDEVVGAVRMSEVIEAYNREIFKLDMCSSLATSLRLQQKMHSQRVSLGGGFQILEANAAHEFVGKSLEDLRLRERFGATVLTIKRESDERDKKVSYILPQPSTVIQKGDTLIVFGLQKNFFRFPTG
jgi:chloride channel protein, CIC family